MARTGRPTRLTQLVDAPTPTDPDRRLTVVDFICERMASTGDRAELCARAAHVDRSTVGLWMTVGKQCADKQRRGELVTIYEQRCLDFLARTNAAHANWYAEHLELVESIAKGGLVLGEITEEVDPTVLDSNGRPTVLKRRVKSSKTLPSIEALKLLLERLAVDEDGHRIFAPRLEVTGADGGPIEVDDRQARIDALNQEADAFLQGAASAAEVAGEKAETNGSALQE